MTDLHIKYAAIIKELRLKRNDVADKALISNGHLTRILSGERPLSDSLRLRLNAILNTDY
jgi:predicted transcriptional regulator